MPSRCCAWMTCMWSASRSKTSRYPCLLQSCSAVAVADNTPRQQTLHGEHLSRCIGRLAGKVRPPANCTSVSALTRQLLPRAERQDEVHGGERDADADSNCGHKGGDHGVLPEHPGGQASHTLGPLIVPPCLGLPNTPPVPHSTLTWNRPHPAASFLGCVIGTHDAGATGGCFIPLTWVLKSSVRT